MLSRCCAALAVAVAAFLTADLRLEDNPNNVVSSRLEGEWIADPGLSERLWPGNARRRDRLAFRADASVVDDVPERYREMFADFPVYMAGVMTRLGREHPFVLIAVHGNPHVLWFRRKGGERFGDLESFNLFVAPAEQRDEDLLLIGGDFNNQPFLAYQRVKRDGALEVVEFDARRRIVGHWEAGSGDDRFGVRFAEDGTLVPYHDGRTPAHGDAGTWRLVDDVTVQIDVAGERSAATFDAQGRLVWVPPAVVAHGETIILTPRHDH